MIKSKMFFLVFIICNILLTLSCDNSKKAALSEDIKNIDTVEETGIVLNPAPVDSYKAETAINDECPECPGQIPETNAVKIVDSLKKNTISNAFVDLNVRITIPKSENPHSEGDIDLWATVIRPAGGKMLPTILIATPYRREMLMLLNIPMVSAGYNLMAVDIRGTGSSSETWDSFGLKEQYDIRYVVDRFIPEQPWSDGKIGMIGGSYMGIIQLLTAGLVDIDPKTGDPVHLKAIFPQAPMADVYRDIVMHGGNVDLLFIPMWLGIVDILGSLPSMLNFGIDGKITQESIKEAQATTKEHINFIPSTIGWVMDSAHMNDGSFYSTRSAMIYWPEKPSSGWGFHEGDQHKMSANLPVFEVAGWFDIFTRGSINTYQHGLSNHKQSDKRLIIGEYYHLEAATGIGLNSILSNKLPIRWFDWKIKNKPDPFMEDYPVMLYVMGEQKWRGEKSWPLPESRTEKRSLYLTKNNPSPIPGDWYTDESVSNTTKYENNNYGLSDTPDFSGTNLTLTHNPLYLHGAESRASVRWLMGVEAIFADMSKFYLGKNIDATQWYDDERNDEKNCLTFTTEPLSEDSEIIGPLTITFWAKTKFADQLTSSSINFIVDSIKKLYKIDENLILDGMNKKDVQWVTDLTDVFPDGRARGITSGWLSAWHRQYNPDGTTNVYYEGPWYNQQKITENALDPAYKPFDPFYFGPDKNPKPIKEGELYQYTIELWPTCNIFKKGHRIRISLSASDFPHLLPIIQPSTNTIIIDEKHIAKIDYTTTNKNDENATWKWIGNNNDADDFVLSDAPTGCGTPAAAAQYKGSFSGYLSEILGLLFIMWIPFSLIILRNQLRRRTIRRI